MLFPRCVHRRFCRVLFHEFHTTRPYLRESLDAFQIDPITARIIIVPTGHSRSKSNNRKIKTLSAGKQSKEKSDRTECFSNSETLSSRLQLYNRRIRCLRTVGGGEVFGPRRTSPGALNGRLPSPSVPTEREAHLGVSENAGGSSCPFHAVLSHIPPRVRSQRL
jgi:hypothetical protein